MGEIKVTTDGTVVSGREGMTILFLSTKAVLEAAEKL